MKKPILICPFLFFVTLGIYGQKNPKDSFYITGRVNIPVEKVYITYLNEENHLIKDSSIVANMKFSLKGSVNCYHKTFVRFKRKGYDLAKEKDSAFFEYRIGLENTVFYLTLNDKELVVKGNKTDKEIERFFNLATQALSDSIDATQNIKKKSLPDSVNLFNLKTAYNKRLIKYYKSHPGNNSLPYILAHSIRYSDNQVIDSLYFRLSTKQQNSTYGRQYKRGYDRRILWQAQLGQPVADFVTSDYKGSIVSLFDNTQKGYVLLDFWASWCNPCRAEHPGMIEIFKKYRKHNLQIISISCDEDENTWKQAIIHDSVFNWTNIITMPPNQPQVAGRLDLLDVFKVTVFPTTFLIDSSNKIVMLTYGISEIEEKLKEIYGE